MGTHPATPDPRFRMMRALRQRVDELEDELVEVGAQAVLQQTRADRLEALIHPDASEEAVEDLRGLCTALAVLDGDLTARDLHPDLRDAARSAVVAALARCGVVMVESTERPALRVVDGGAS